MKNQPKHETKIREGFQRLKRADEIHTPSFDNVLNRSAALPAKRFFPRLALVAGLAAAISLGTFVFQSIHLDSPETEVANHGAGNFRVAIDFDDVREVIAEHFESPGDDFGDLELNGLESPFWSSRTDSFLALDLNANFNQE